MKKDELLKLLNKYGFNSVRKEPFLYDGKEGLGFSYSFKDPFYGPLTRAYIPKDSVAAEEFLMKYYWYKKNGDTYGLCLSLDDYEIPTPQVKFMYQGEEATTEMLNQLLTTSTEKKEKDSAFLRKLRRTLLLLLEILVEKMRLQKETYHNLLSLTNKYIDKENEFQEKWNVYQKKDFEPLRQFDLEPEENNADIIVNDYKKMIMNTDNIDALTNLVYQLVDMIQKLEVDEGYLQNKYELIKLPLQIQLMKKKIEVLDDFVNRKKNIFSRKEDLDQLLDTVEKDNPIKNIVAYEQYCNNEKQRINDKYAVIPDLDIRTVADYLIEFDNLKVREPIVIENKDDKVSFAVVMDNLEKDYQNLSKEKQYYLIAFYYLSKLMDDRAIERFISYMNNPNNIMMKYKYFRSIECTSIEECKASIQKFIGKIKQISPFNLLGSINVFWKELEDVIPNGYLRVSSKRVLAPVQRSGNHLISYIGNLSKNIGVYFIPNEIVEDVYSDGTLVLSDHRPLLIIDMKNCVVSNDFSDIIKVADFVAQEENQGTIRIVHELKNRKVMYFKKVSLERNSYES